MRTETQEAIIEHAKREYPRECCGLLINAAGREIYFPCRNAGVGTDNFQLHPADYVAGEAKGQIIAIVHSHPDASAVPSQADLVACEKTGLPWHILGYPTLQWESITPNGYCAPLLGRAWSHGVLDCYSLLRDWYKSEYNINLLDFARRDEWWWHGDNLYEDNFQSAGFVEVQPPLERGDVILMQILANVTNHAAVYLGDGMMIHHLFKRLSCREIYGGYWRKHTRRIVRHRELL